MGVSRPVATPWRITGRAKVSASLSNPSIGLVYSGRSPGELVSQPQGGAANLTNASSRRMSVAAGITEIGVFLLFLALAILLKKRRRPSAAGWHNRNRRLSALSCFGHPAAEGRRRFFHRNGALPDRKSTRLNSSHLGISY